MQTNTTVQLRQDDVVAAHVHWLNDREQFIVLRVSETKDHDFLSLIVSHTNRACAERARAIANSLLAAAEQIDPTLHITLADEVTVSGDGVQSA